MRDIENLIRGQDRYPDKALSKAELDRRVRLLIEELAELAKPHRKKPKK